MLLIAADIQPVQNLRVLKYRGLEHKLEWGKYFISLGFDALEAMLEKTAGVYCFGDSLTMADVCIVPQVYNARRFNVDMDMYPIISRIDETLGHLPSFQQAHPLAQPDCTN